MKNKKLILTVTAIGFAGFLAISYLAYNSLGPKYDKKDINISKDTSQDKEEETDTPTVQDKKAEKDFVVYDEKLNKVKLSDYKGRPIIVNFWASWCPPCKEEMPLFNKLSSKYKAEELTVLMVDLTDGQRETMDKAKKYILDNDYEMKILFDNDGTASINYNIIYIPRTLFIDKDGNIIEDHSGEITEDELKSQVQLLLSK